MNNKIKINYIDVFHRHCQRNNIIEVKKLIKQDVINYSHYHTALIIASKNGDREIVELLLTIPDIEPHYSDNRAIEYASKEGHAHIIHMLLKHSFVKYTISKPFLRTCISQISIPLQEDAKKMIPFYSDAFYEKYQLPDDIMHIILGEFTFNYTQKECLQLLKLL